MAMRSGSDGAGAGGADGPPLPVVGGSEKEELSLIVIFGWTAGEDGVCCVLLRLMSFKFDAGDFVGAIIPPPPTGVMQRRVDVLNGQRLPCRNTIFSFFSFLLQRVFLTNEMA